MLFEKSDSVSVRTDKANFGPPPMVLIFSAKVSHYIKCRDIILFGSI